MSNIEALREEARTVLMSAPQAGFFKEKDIEAWLDAVILHDPQRLLWHAKRVSGFGGSEIGAMVSEHFYDPTSPSSSRAHTFSSVRTIISQKLLLAHPEFDIPQAKAGIYFEDGLRRMLIDQLRAEGKQVMQDSSMVKAIGQFRSPQHPWMKCSLDDVLIIDGKRIIPDYKFLGTNTFADYFRDGVPLTYRCQGAQYRMAAESLSVAIEEVAVAAYDAQNGRIELMPYETDELEEQIRQAGDHYWNNFLLKGKLPPYPKWQDEKIVSQDAISHAHRDLVDRWTALTVIESQTSTQREIVAQQLQGFFDGYRLTDPTKKEVWPFGAASVTISHTPDFNEHYLTAIAKKAGFLDEYEKPSRVKYDLPALYERVSKLSEIDPSIDMAKAVTYRLKVATSLSRKKKGLEKDLRDGIEERGLLHTSAAEANLASDVLQTRELYVHKHRADEAILQTYERILTNPLMPSTPEHIDTPSSEVPSLSVQHEDVEVQADQVDDPTLRFRLDTSRPLF